MYNLRRLQALVMGHEVNTSVLHTQLEASSVPVSLADCRTCADPCDLGMLGGLALTPVFD